MTPRERAVERVARSGSLSHAQAGELVDDVLAAVGHDAFVRRLIAVERARDRYRSALWEIVVVCEALPRLPFGLGLGNGCYAIAKAALTDGGKS